MTLEVYLPENSELTKGDRKTGNNPSALFATDDALMGEA